MNDINRPMNQAERLEHFLATTNVETEIDKSFLPLVRRIWVHKDGMKIFAMVDDSYILLMNDMTKTFATTDNMAEAMLQYSTKDSRNAKAKSSTVEYLRGDPTAQDIQREGSPIEVVIAQLAKAICNG